MLGFLMPGGGEPQVEKMDVDSAIARTAAGEVILIDVREDAELRATGTAEGALHIPLGEVEERLAPGAEGNPLDVDPERPVVLYCGAGVRAQQAGEILLRLGYPHVFNMGGFGNWQAANGPIVMPDD